MICWSETWRERSSAYVIGQLPARVGAWSLGAGGVFTAGCRGRLPLVLLGKTNDTTTRLHSEHTEVLTHNASQRNQNLKHRIMGLQAQHGRVLEAKG